MTKISMQTVNCPACGKEASFRVYESINAGLDPELKKKLYTEESPLIFTCPHCGKKSFVSYDFLYHGYANGVYPQVTVAAGVDGSVPGRCGYS